MNTARIRSWHAGIATTGILLCMATAAGAQDDGPARGRVPTSGVPAWFSLPLPPKPGATPAVVVGTRGPRVVTLPPGEAESPEFDGATIPGGPEGGSGDCHRRAARRRKSAPGSSGAGFRDFPRALGTIEWAG